MTNCTHRSLKKLEMPYLRQKLGFLGAIDGERVTGTVYRIILFMVVAVLFIL